VGHFLTSDAPVLSGKKQGAFPQEGRGGRTRARGVADANSMSRPSQAETETQSWPRHNGRLVAGGEERDERNGRREEEQARAAGGGGAGIGGTESAFVVVRCENDQASEGSRSCGARPKGNRARRGGAPALRVLAPSRFAA
jgi:hypothetical protein